MKYHDSMNYLSTGRNQQTVVEIKKPNASITSHRPQGLKMKSL